MPPRAYLAHSSSDKAYVEEVVSRLSRAHVIFDKQSFEPREDFRQLIREGLEKASLLVLFASPDSLILATVVLRHVLLCISCPIYYVTNPLYIRPVWT